MGSISCQNQLILDAWRRYLAVKGRFSRPGPLRGCTATKYCHDLPLRNALQLGLTQEGTFRCTRFFVAVLASPRKGHITALTPPRRGWTAALAPPATALAPSRRGHANTAVKDEPQRWSRAGPRIKSRIAKAWQDSLVMHDLRDSDGKRAP